MATACITQVAFGFEPKDKPVVGQFESGHEASQGKHVFREEIDSLCRLSAELRREAQAAIECARLLVEQSRELRAELCRDRSASRPIPPDES